MSKRPISSIDGGFKYQPCKVVAEIGCNHMGSVEIAKELMKLAKDCGARPTSNLAHTSTTRAKRARPSCPRAHSCAHRRPPRYRRTLGTAHIAQHAAPEPRRCDLRQVPEALPP